jgi:hypothetical protein
VATCAPEGSEAKSIVPMTRAEPLSSADANCSLAGVRLCSPASRARSDPELAAACRGAVDLAAATGTAPRRFNSILATVCSVASATPAGQSWTAA